MKIFEKTKIFLFLSFFCVLLFSNVSFEAQAQTSPPSKDPCSSGIVPCGRNCDNLDTDANETDKCTLCHLIVGIHIIISYGLKILTYVALVMIVIGGIIYMVSAGNQNMITLAKNIIWKTLAGFAIVLGAWVLVNYTMYLIGTKTDLGIGVTAWNEFKCKKK